MGFLKLLERTPTRLHYVRRPSYRSWMVLIGLSLLGISIAASSTDDSFAWRVMYAVSGLLLGYICFDKWEECILDKKTAHVTLVEQSMADRFVFGKSRRVVGELNGIMDVTIQKEVVRYAGTGYQVVYVLILGFH
eukprot:m.44193 g.44193  ORF g.44193 m.44193 type:complete len:135 (+) comp33502_c0_seq3:19-423(+)